MNTAAIIHWREQHKCIGLLHKAVKASAASTGINEYEHTYILMHIQLGTYFWSRKFYVMGILALLLHQIYGV